MLGWAAGLGNQTAKEAILKIVVGFPVVICYAPMLSSIIESLVLRSLSIEPIVACLYL